MRDSFGAITTYYGVCACECGCEYELDYAGQRICEPCEDRCEGASTATEDVPSCVGCFSPTTETVRGRFGDREGVMCADCQFHCDGNIILA